jgi:hypothetical protein
MSKYLKFTVLVLVTSLFCSCANTLAAAGYLLGVILEWSLILFGIGIAIVLLIMLIGWIISWFK